MHCWMVWLVLFLDWLGSSKVSKFGSRKIVKKIRSYMGKHENFLMI